MTYKSKFEQTVASTLAKKRIKFQYEDAKFKFTQPEKKRTYTPDFHIKETDVYIETKGKLDKAGRDKLIWVKEQNPKLKLVVLFMNARNSIRKGSQTTYGDWADSVGIEWADFRDGIPQHWIKNAN